MISKELLAEHLAYLSMVCSVTLKTFVETGHVED